MTDTNFSSIVIHRIAPTLRELQVCASVATFVGAVALFCVGRINTSADVHVVATATNGPLSSAPVWQVELNNASQAELELLPGIGSRRAQAIIQERTRRGAFTSVWELTEIPGLSKALVQRLAPMLRVQSFRE